MLTILYNIPELKINGIQWHIISYKRNKIQAGIKKKN